MRREVVVLAMAGLMIGIPGVVGETDKDPIQEQIIGILDELCTQWGETARPIVQELNPENPGTIDSSEQVCHDAVSKIPSDWGTCVNLVGGTYDLIDDLDTNPYGKSGGFDLHIPIAATSLYSIDLPPKISEELEKNTLDLRQLNPRTVGFLAIAISGPGVASTIGLCD